MMCFIVRYYFLNKIILILTLSKTKWNSLVPQSTTCNSSKCKNSCKILPAECLSSPLIPARIPASARLLVCLSCLFESDFWPGMFESPSWVLPQQYRPEQERRLRWTAGRYTGAPVVCWQVKRTEVAGLGVVWVGECPASSPCRCS